MDEKLQKALEAFKHGGGRYEDALKALSSVYIPKPRDAEVIAFAQHKLAGRALKKGSG